MTLRPASGLVSRERWDVLEPLLDAALSRASADREAFLDVACAGDATLRAELAGMLADCERVAAAPHGTLDRPAAERFTALAGAIDDGRELARVREALARRYAVERVVGRGGMATVYLAHDLRHDRAVAIKVLRSESGAAGAARFQREIRLAARLQHPHVVPVFDSGAADDGLLYYCMPYVAGETLRARLRREPRLAVPDAVRLLRELACALAYAHAEGVVHRDLKPENVLLSHGYAVLADLGVAKALAAAAGEGDGAATANGSGGGVTVGTPAYMAPEQVAADPDTDHRADLYALGLVAYEVLAGAHPFAGRAPAALLSAQLTEIPPPLSDLRPDIPPALGALVVRLLAKRADGRPADAGDVARALDELATGGAGEQRAVVPPPDAALAPPSHRRAARVSAVLGVVAVTLALVGVAVSRRAGTRPVAPSDTVVPPPARRVLVMPLENATGDSTLAPLGRMAADWIAEGLARTGIVEVVPGPAGPAAEGDSGLRAAASTSGAGTVVSGAYYLDGDSVRLQARVTDVARWRLLRAVAPVGAPRRAPNTSLEPLRQRVMSALAVAHDPRFAGWEIGTPPPTYAAYEQLLAGLDLFERADWRAAIPYFARAASLDTTYAQPLLAAADAYGNLGLPAAEDSVLRILERRREALAPADRAHLDRLRAVLDGDNMAALVSARAVVAAAPGAQVPRYLHAAVATRAGRPREALAAAAPIATTFGRVRSEWTGRVYWREVTAAHHLLGEHEAELAAARTGRAYHPDSRTIRVYELRALVALGRLDTLGRALDALETMPGTPGSVPVPTLLVALAQELAAHGHAAESRDALRRAVGAVRAAAPADQRRPAVRYELARALYFLGDDAAAAPLCAALAAEQPDDPRHLGCVGVVAARRGDRAAARRVSERLRTVPRPFDRGRATYARAQIAAALGDLPEALTLLRQSLTEGVPYGTALHAETDFAPLRGDPGFIALSRPRG